MTLPLSKVIHTDDFSSEEYMGIKQKYNLGFNSRVSHLDYSRDNRKDWEITMAVYGLDSCGAIREDAEILGIGAATEETIGAISPYVKRVFATDLYFEPGSWEEWLPKQFIVRPQDYFPGGCNPRRIVVQHADGLDLPYEDNSFDGIFSSSSIEHFGDEDDIRKAIEEAHRVLKPGGVAAISTEWKISGPGGGWDNVQVFDEERLKRVWLDGIDWTLQGDLETSLPDVPRVDFIRSINDREYALNFWPHVILSNGIYEWTSVHLTLVKN